MGGNAEEGGGKVQERGEMGGQQRSRKREGEKRGGEEKQPG